VSSLNGSIHHHNPHTKDENASIVSGFSGAEHILGGAPSDASGLVGSDLTASDYAALESRWIDRTLADRAGLRRVNSPTGSEVIGRKSGNYAGILIPYRRPGSDHVREYRLRRDQPDLEYDSAGNLKPRQKYLSPPGRSNMLYLAPGIGQSFLRDPAVPIVIAEGEFKTLALWRLANYGAPIQPRFLPLGVSGVYNWRGTNRQDGRAGRQPARCEGSNSGSGLGRLGRSSRRDRL
jgi:hypothetical protein